jgi:hypothetical protein
MSSNFDLLAGRNAYVGTTLSLADGVNLRLGQSLLEPFRPGLGQSALDYFTYAGLAGRSGEASVAGIDWDFASWGGVSVAASQSDQRNGFWGGNPGSLPLAKSSNNALGVSAHLGLGGGWVTSFSYNEAVTQLDLRPAGATAAANDTVHGGGYGLAVAKHGLFGDDTFGLAITRPLQIYSGGLDFGAASASDPLSDLLLQNARSPLAGQARETDLDFGYVTTFMDGALALQANAGYQTNVDGQSGTRGVSVLSRAKINF